MHDPEPEADHQLLFIEVPDTKTVKNRIHFDLRPSAGTRDEEVERLLGIGATEVDDQRDHYGPGVGWVVMADPEGNRSACCAPRVSAPPRGPRVAT